MKQLLVVGTALLGLAASAPVAYAQRFEFDYIGSLVKFTVPIDGTYQIVAFGAQAGSGGIGPGGLGAEIGGIFNLTAGEVLQIAVGGASSGAGGGGGSFVVGPDNKPLVIAGGGGGGGGQTLFPAPGQGGLTGPDGGGGVQNGTPEGGTGGNGGAGSICVGGGGGGGGFLSAGGNGFSFGGVTGGGGGSAFPSLAGGAGGTFHPGDGGYGGGGGAALGPGGGGGYSGGGGGCGHSGGISIGGGGGSFDGGTDQILVADIWPSNGEVVITIVSPVFAGTPLKANCIGQSVSTLARQFGGLNGAAEALGYPTVEALQDGIMAFCQKPIG